MNYIAHIHIGSHTNTDLLGNFLGDFVKGSQLTHLPVALEQGIRLHRSIDVFTDSHPLIVDVKRCFPKDIRRMSGVIIDIYFDYLLMKHWRLYSEVHFNVVFEQFYQQLELFSIPVSQHFANLSSRLQSYRWLDEYANIGTCVKAFTSIEKRLKNKVLFAHKAEAYLKHNGEQLESIFQQFYPECLEHGISFVRSYSIQHTPK
jgi:acyl carrier protein phosphodiesterase